MSRESDDIIVTNYPRLEEMCSIISGQHRGDHAFSLLQDKSFFQWRFNNQRNNYLFYYSRKNNVTTGYIVMCVSKNNWFGRIIDYAENDSAVLKKILEYVIHERHFSMLSILDCSLEDNFLKILKDLRIHKNRIFHMGKRIVKGIWPLLIRPVKKSVVKLIGLSKELTSGKSGTGISKKLALIIVRRIGISITPIIPTFTRGLWGGN